MTSQIFTLRDDNEFITLDKLLKLMRMVGSGGEAHAVIEEGIQVLRKRMAFWLQLS